MSTGMETMPKEIVADAMERAIFVPFWIDPLCCPLIRSKLTELAMQVRLRPDDIVPHVALPLQAFENVPHPEVHRVRICQLVPGERHGHRRPLKRARRIS